MNAGSECMSPMSGMASSFDKRECLFSRTSLSLYVWLGPIGVFLVCLICSIEGSYRSAYITVLCITRYTTTFTAENSPPFCLHGHDAQNSKLQNSI